MLDLPARISDSLLMLLHAQRVLAHLVVDDAQNLVQAGGHLDHYGLTGLQSGGLASDQIPFLEGLLPLVETPFLIRSMEMPSGRVADVHFFADDGTVWILLLDVTAEYEEARLVQQKAYDMTLLSQREARLIAQLEAANQELTLAHRELAASREALQVTHDRLQDELREAERYVRAILPPPPAEPLAADWRFVPSTELGGDSFGYHWVDDEHFALYLIDVCGHGVGSALLSVAVADTLRSEALQRTDFRSPAAVLTAPQPGLPDGAPAGELLCDRLGYGVSSPGHGRAALCLGRPSAGPAGRAAPAKPPAMAGAAAGQRPLHRHLAGRPLPGGALPPAIAGAALRLQRRHLRGRPAGRLHARFSALAEALSRPVAGGASELDRLLECARRPWPWRARGRLHHPQDDALEPAPHSPHDGPCRAGQGAARRVRRCRVVVLNARPWASPRRVRVASLALNRAAPAGPANAGEMPSSWRAGGWRRGRAQLARGPVMGAITRRGWRSIGAGLVGGRARRAIEFAASSAAWEGRTAMAANVDQAEREVSSIDDGECSVSQSTAGFRGGAVHGARAARPPP